MKSPTPAHGAPAQIWSKMAKIATAINNFGAKTAAKWASSTRKIAAPKRKKSRSWPPIGNVRACGALPGFSGFRGTPWPSGSKKVKTQPPLKATLLPAEPDDILEYDEMWSFVAFRKNKRWLWTVMCRRTRQIIAFALGDRSAQTCRRLWSRIPEEYRTCASFSDFWEAYQEVLPAETHQQVGKDSGQLNHMERWNCTLRQWLGRFTRKTLSFSKVDYMHHLVTRWFIVEYNLTIQRSFT